MVNTMQKDSQQMVLVVQFAWDLQLEAVENITNNAYGVTRILAVQQNRRGEVGAAFAVGGRVMQATESWGFLVDNLEAFNKIVSILNEVRLSSWSTLLYLSCQSASRYIRM